MSTRKKKHRKKIERKNIIPHKKEIIGLIIITGGILSLGSFCLEDNMGLFGFLIRSILLGMFGITAFIVPFTLILYGGYVVFGSKQGEKIKFAYMFTLLMLISAIIQVYTRDIYDSRNFFQQIYDAYINGIRLGGGGVVGNLIEMPLMLMLRKVGSIIILVMLIIINLMLITEMSLAVAAAKIKNGVVNCFNSLNTLLKNTNRKIKDRETKPTQIFNEDISNKSGNTRCKNKKNDGSVAADQAVEMDNIPFDISEEMVPKISMSKELKNKNKANTSLRDDLIKKIPLPDQSLIIYKYPPTDMLNYNSESINGTKDFRSSAVEGAKKLEDTLRSFGVETKVINISIGPAVTRYELQPKTGVKVSKIVGLADDISLNLASTGIRIEAPIPGKAAVGIEVPNKEVIPVFLREVIESPEFMKHPSKLAFALGKDISGRTIVADVARMPHVLVAGATGSGKSVCINSLIMSLLFKASPDEVKLIMVDPKVVELGIYNGIPHLLVPVVTDPRKAAGALSWAVQEMIKRYKTFADMGVRDIKGYNDVIRERSEDGEALPQIVIIIDELSDLMMVAPNEVEDSICRLAQMARAAGMHLVIATQRPSVDVITGIIKANIPSRIAFAVSSQIDSRTILDMAGAERLQGRGDMLFYPVGEPKPIRVKGTFVSDKEVENVVEYIKCQASAQYSEDIMEEINGGPKGDTETTDADEFLEKAITLVVETGQASASLIQRKFKVGYARAGRIVDQMESRGIVGMSEGSKPRPVLITKEQWYELQMNSKE